MMTTILFLFLILSLFTTTLACETRLPISRLANVSASIKEEDITPNEIEVSWEFECEVQQRLLSQFTIEYCLLPECPFENHKKSLSPSSIVLTLQNYHNLTSYSLEKLTPNSTYRIFFFSSQIAKRYELLGKTDISVPEPPTDVRISFLKDIEGPILEWDLSFPVGTLKQNIIDYFYVTVSELISGEFIYLNDKIDTG